jgi:hypothetical protein
MLENSDQEINNDPVHLQVQFLINLVLRTGTKANLSSPISSKPIELCYANKKAFPFCDPIFCDPIGVVKALRIHVLLME